MELISVIIPVYNVKAFLEKCVKSVICQSYRNLEIILIDDGSTDGSGELCDEYSKIDSRINTIHKENGGLSSARNVGIEASNGDYLFFLDSDDWISEDAIEYLYNLSQNDIDVVIGDFIRMSSMHMSKNEDLKESVEIISGSDAIERIYCKRSAKMVSACAKLFCRYLFDDIRFPVGLLHEDEATTYKIYYKCKNIAVTNRIVYYYYVNSNSITSNKTKKNFIDITKILNNQINFFLEKKEYKFSDMTRCRYCIISAIYYIPINHYGDSKMIRNKAKSVFGKIKNKYNLNKVLYIKAFVCTKFMPLASCLITFKRFCGNCLNNHTVKIRI